MRQILYKIYNRRPNSFDNLKNSSKKCLIFYRVTEK